MNRYLLLAIVFAALPACAFAFSFDLKLGDKGADVLALQRLLNKNPLTQVNASGPGSPGSETNYFGPATKQAVIRFQELHRREILVPASLLVGTGYVGPATRKKLAEISQAASIISVPNTITPSAQFAKQVAPFVHSITPNSVEKGVRMVIRGEGFTPSNNKITARFGAAAQVVEGVASIDGKTLEFIFEPPSLPPASSADIQKLPPEAVSQLTNILAAQNLTLNDILNTPYPGIKNMEELKADLARKGRTIEDLKDRYIIVVENANGRSNYNVSFKGLRTIQFDL